MHNSQTELKSLFQIDKQVTFLNFGSFGACPIPIFDEYLKWQLLLEKQPVQYFDDDVVSYLKNSRSISELYHLQCR